MFWKASLSAEAGPAGSTVCRRGPVLGLLGSYSIPIALFPAVSPKDPCPVRLWGQKMASLFSSLCHMWGPWKV